MNKFDLFSTNWHVSHSKKFVWKLIRAGIKYLIVEPSIVLKNLTVEIFNGLTDFIFWVIDGTINCLVCYSIFIYLLFFKPFWLKESAKKIWFFYDTRQSVDGNKEKCDQLINIFEELKKESKWYFLALMFDTDFNFRADQQVECGGASIPLDSHDINLLWYLAYFYKIGYINEPILKTDKFETGIGPEFYIVHYNCDDYESKLEGLGFAPYSASDDDYYKRWKEFVERDPRLE